MEQELPRSCYYHQFPSIKKRPSALLHIWQPLQSAQAGSITLCICPPLHVAENQEVKTEQRRVAFPSEILSRTRGLPSWELASEGSGPGIHNATFLRICLPIPHFVPLMGGLAFRVNLFLLGRAKMAWHYQVKCLEQSPPSWCFLVGIQQSPAAWPSASELSLTSEHRPVGWREEIFKTVLVRRNLGACWTT